MISGNSIKLNSAVVTMANLLLQQGSSLRWDRSYIKRQLVNHFTNESELTTENLFVFLPVLLAEGRRKEEAELKRRAEEKRKKDKREQEDKVKRIIRFLKSKSIYQYDEASVRRFLEEENWRYQSALKRIIDIEEEKERQVEKQQKAIERVRTGLSRMHIDAPGANTLKKMLREHGWKPIAVTNLIVRSYQEEQQRRKRVIGELGMSAPLENSKAGDAGSFEPRPDILNQALWLDTKFALLLQKLSDLSTRMGKIEHYVGGIEEIQTELSDLPIRLDNIERYLDEIETIRIAQTEDTRNQGRVDDHSQTIDEESVHKGLNVLKVDWEILRPGKWKVEDIIDHYRRLAEQYPSEYQAGRIQWERIREIQKLDPQNVILGKNKWRGYGIYDFSKSANVVLECPLEGNAVYILKGPGWEKLTRLTKREIRDYHRGFYQKVVHKNDWLSRVSGGLRTL